MTRTRMPAAGCAEPPKRFGSVLVWLLLPIGLASLVHIGSGRLSRPEYAVNDSQSYLDIVETGVFTKESLQSVRTLGYPAFLQAACGVFGSLNAVPSLQWTAFCGAVVFLAYAFFRIGAPVPLTLALTAPLFFSDLTISYAPALRTEMLGCTLAIGSVAALLLATSRPSRLGWWGVLAVLVFLAYQVRPAFLCLLVLVPVFAVVLYPVLHSRPGVRSDTCRVLGIATASVAAPYLGFCVLRLVLVGHFGLLSFGGINLVGITGSLLNEDMLAHLTPDIRPLASKMLEIRSSGDVDLARYNTQAEWDDAIREGSLGLPDYLTVAALYNPTIYEVAYPAAREIYGDDNVARNRAFSRLSWQVISLRPVSYIVWIVYALYHGLRTSVTLYLMLALYLLIGAVLLLQRSADLFLRNRRNRGGALILDEQEQKFFAIAATIAIVFFGSKVLLVALVEPTLVRYMQSAAIFLPMLPAMVIYCLIRNWLPLAADPACGYAE